MRTTITLDDELIAEAKEINGIDKNTVVMREGLKALIEREAARHLAQLGGRMPDLDIPPRARPKSST